MKKDSFKLETLLSVTYAFIGIILTLIFQSSLQDGKLFFLLIIGVVLFIILTFVYLVEFIVKIMGKMNAPITAKINKYYDDDNGFENVIKLVNKAEKKIIILDYIEKNDKMKVDQTQSNESMTSIEKEFEYKKWFNAIEDKCRSGIIYERIIQIDNDSFTELEKNNQIDLQNKRLINHLKQCIDIRKNISEIKYLKNVSLYLTKTVIMSTCIIIIDDKYLIWEAPFLDDKGNFDFSFDIIIEDHDKQVVEDLCQKIQSMKNENSKIISEEMLIENLNKKENP
jgi:hypothetical protein